MSLKNMILKTIPFNFIFNHLSLHPIVATIAITSNRYIDGSLFLLLSKLFMKIKYLPYKFKKHYSITKVVREFKRDQFDTKNPDVRIIKLL